MGVTLAGAPEEQKSAHGFKRSPAGVIPEEWNVRPLGECLRSRPDYGINAPAVPHRDGLPTYVRITDITEEGRFAPGPRVAVDDRRSDDYFLSPGDLVFARTGASVGKSYLYNPDDGPLVFAGFLIRVRPNPTVLDPAFLAQYVQTETFAAWVRTMSLRSGQPGINSQEYASLPVPLPPVEEQRVIASALGDVDRLINAIDRLIEKKRDFRHGVAQRLLTAQTRLPGFTGDWRATRIGSIGETYGGLSGKSAEDFGHGDARYVPFLNVLENVRIDPTRYERVAVGRREKQNGVRVGDLLFNGTSETPDELAMGAVVTATVPRLFLNSFCFCFRLNRPDEHDPLFLAYAFRGPVGRRLLYALAQGATRYNLSKAQFKNLEVPLPKVTEQRAIATVLSDFDAEIEALVARRAKMRDVKIGMAQALLAGRRRLAVRLVAA